MSSTNTLPKEGEATYEIKDSKEALTDFNSKLLTALNYSPKDKPERKKRTTKPKTKECPVCGKECDKKAKYCDGEVDMGDGKTAPCPHVF